MLALLGFLSSNVQANVAGQVKATAMLIGNQAVLNLTVVSSATAPTVMVNFTPPPPLVVNPNQVAGSPN